MSELYQTFMDENYVYAVTNSGLDLYDVVSEELYSYIDYSDGFTTVWASDSAVYLGTSSSGIKHLTKTCISGSVVSPYDLSSCLNDYLNYPNITSDSITYIHGNDGYFMCCTDIGVDAIHDFRSYTTVSGARKCFMTSTGKFYYTVEESSEWFVNRMNHSLCDWSEPDYSYITGSGILPAGEDINDIFITEETAEDGINNTLFVATSSGVYVIDEYSLSYYNNVFGDSNDFIAIWADSDASLSYGKMYVASKGPGAKFSVVDLENKEVLDYYTVDHAGRGNEILESDDIIDINV